MNTEYLVSKFTNVFEGLPPKYQTCIILTGMVGTLIFGIYAINQGITITCNENSWSVSIKSTSLESL